MKFYVEIDNKLKNNNQVQKKSKKDKEDKKTLSEQEIPKNPRILME